MIVGLGTDLCDARRIERTLARFGDRFLERVFTAGERARCQELARPAECFARRWAAKEACAKALGTGFSNGVFLGDIEVVRGRHGAPGLRLRGGAAARLAEIIPEGRESRLHLTISDEPPNALAFVVIEAT